MTFAQHLRTLTILSAGAIASVAFAAGAAPVSQEVWVGAEPVVVGKPLSRAEVQADLQLWKQAGLDAYQQGDHSFHSATYQAQLAHYQQLRNSPAYAERVQKLQAAAQ